MGVAGVALQSRPIGAFGGAVVNDRQDALKSPLLALGHVLLRRAGRGGVAIDSLEHRVGWGAAGAGVDAARLAGREGTGEGDGERACPGIGMKGCGHGQVGCTDSDGDRTDVEIVGIEDDHRERFAGGEMQHRLADDMRFEEREGDVHVIKLHRWPAKRGFQEAVSAHKVSERPCGGIEWRPAPAFRSGALTRDNPRMQGICMATQIREVLHIWQVCTSLHIAIPLSGAHPRFGAFLGARASRRMALS